MKSLLKSSTQTAIQGLSISQEKCDIGCRCNQAIKRKTPEFKSKLFRSPSNYFLSKSPFSNLQMRKAHEEVAHVGVAEILAHLTKLLWIIKSRH